MCRLQNYKLSLTRLKDCVENKAASFIGPDQCGIRRSKGARDGIAALLSRVKGFCIQRGGSANGGVVRRSDHNGQDVPAARRHRATQCDS